MSKLELKIPPVLVTLIIGGLSWLLSSTGWALPVQFSVRLSFAVVLFIAGIAIAGAGVREFLRANTTVNPHRPRHCPRHTSVLVTSGIYLYTRNPMYLGLLLGLLGWALLLGNLLAFAPLLLFILYMNRFQIEPEEQTLSVIFGQEYSAYRNRVKRWL